MSRDSFEAGGAWLPGLLPDILVVSVSHSDFCMEERSSREHDPHLESSVDSLHMLGLDHRTVRLVSRKLIAEKPQQTFSFLSLQLMHATWILPPMRMRCDALDGRALGVEAL